MGRSLVRSGVNSFLGSWNKDFYRCFLNFKNKVGFVKGVLSVMIVFKEKRKRKVGSLLCVIIRVEGGRKRRKEKFVIFV